jgi:hypothetical protein
MDMKERLERLNKILSVDESNATYHPSKPEKFDTEIKDTSEKAFQRAILFDETSKLDNYQGIEVTWYDIELPVVFNKKPRRSSIDIIGHDSNRFVLCELKFNNTKDSPSSATKELLKYYRSIIINAENLDKDSIHHKNDICKKHSWEWSSIVKITPLLVIGANNNYWKYWRVKGIFKNDLLQIESWSKEIDVEIVLYDINVNDNYFKLQKVNDQLYTPKLIVNDPWVRIQY